ncbi:Ankyrin repeat-containing domain [Penicillium roqueforti FM164]|nr:Ankyrin repeat-containing domain [Penicillium roqueforti FM164]CRL31530.1 Ankyrin repeat-containing domain [Penicillium camemberti]
MSYCDRLLVPRLLSLLKDSSRWVNVTKGVNKTKIQEQHWIRSGDNRTKGASTRVITVMHSSRFPDLPGSGYPQMSTLAREIPIQLSKKDQQRERNRQAQRKHRESVKQQLEKFDRLRQCLQDLDSGPKASKDLANLPLDEQQNCPSPSAGENSSIPVQSILPSVLPEVDEPINSQCRDPINILTRPFIASTGYTNGLCSQLSKSHDGDSSLASSRVEEHYLMAFPPPDTSFSLDPNHCPPLELESNTRACNWRAPGRTLLHQGVFMDSEDIVLVLLAQVADVEARDHDGRTPLHLAAALGHARIGRLLLMHGAAATLSLEDRHGLTAMHLAVQNGHAPIVEDLVEFGADVNLQF